MKPIALADLDWDQKILPDEGSFGGKVYQTTWSLSYEDGDPVKDTVSVIDMDAPRGIIFAERGMRSSLNYKNVVQLLGWCQVSNLQHPMLVFEHSNDGDLWNYLHRYSGEELTFDVMKKLAYDIARGMDYLHDEAIIHGDVAARNCLIFQPENVQNIWDWKVKLGDSGYYCSSFEGCYNNQPGDLVRCPVRWMPPENLPFRFLNGKVVPTDHKKSKEGDIWAFGMVLFEIWTKGAFPFAGLTDKQCIVMPSAAMYA